jgi:hypothetical protein
MASSHDDLNPSPAPHGIQSHMSSSARSIIDLVDDLRKIGISQDLPIPQIAVMGDQSSGKSSVLEAISSIPFPRGNGLVTRCATQIRMSNCATWAATIRWVDPTGQESGDIVTITSPDQIADQIERVTSELDKGNQKNIVTDKEIEIVLQSPDVPNLTIIDLPGIVRTSTRGQSEGLMGEVDALLNRYLEEERTIILAVVPVNVDVATVDILERAKKVDPTGDRTMGVLTKPDLVEKGNEAAVLGLLTNREKPLKHGYVMLKNRTPAQLSAGMTLDEARAAETAWFATSYYSTAKGAEDVRLGVGQLTPALTELLIALIHTAIPSMKREISERLGNSRQDLDKCGEAPPSTPQACLSAAITATRRFAQGMHTVANEAGDCGLGDTVRVLYIERKVRAQFGEDVRQTRPGFNGEDDTWEVEVIDCESDGVLNDGVIHRDVGDLTTIFSHDIEVPTVGDNVDVHYPDYGFTECEILARASYFRADIAKKIDTFRGRELPGFLNFALFSKIMQEYVQRWAGPAETFRAAVSASFVAAAGLLIKRETETHPALQSRLITDVTAFVESADTLATERLDQLIYTELLPSTENHYLWDTLNKIRDQRVTKKVEEMSTIKDGWVDKKAVLALLKSDLGNESNESAEVTDMIDMLSAYWKLAVKRYIDEAAMVIASTYTRPECIVRLQSKLDEHVLSTDPDRLVQLFRQNPALQRRRQQLTDTITRLSNAKSRIDAGFD